MTNPGGSVILARALKNAELEMLEGLGHNLHIEREQQISRRLLDFLAVAESTK
jgi:pimeloyl-ACP methyl ester carboxylesterase